MSTSTDNVTDLTAEPLVPEVGWQSALQRISDATIGLTELSLFSPGPPPPLPRRRGYVYRSSSGESSSGGDSDSEADWMMQPTEKKISKAFYGGTNTSSNLKVPSQQPHQRPNINLSVLIQDDTPESVDNHTFVTDPHNSMRVGRRSRLTRRNLDSVAYPHTHLVSTQRLTENQLLNLSRRSIVGDAAVQDIQGAMTDSKNVPMFFTTFKSEHRTSHPSDSSHKSHKHHTSIKNHHRNRQSVRETNNPSLHEVSSITPSITSQSSWSPSRTFSQRPSTGNSTAIDIRISPPAVFSSVISSSPLQSLSTAQDSRRRSSLAVDTITPRGSVSSRRSSTSSRPSQVEGSIGNNSSISDLDSATQEEEFNILSDIKIGDQRRLLLSRCVIDGKPIRFKTDITRCQQGIPTAPTDIGTVAHGVRTPPVISMNSQPSRRRASLIEDASLSCCYCHRDLDSFDLHVHDWQRTTIPQYLSPGAIIYFSSPYI